MTADPAPDPAPQGTLHAAPPAPVPTAERRARLAARLPAPARDWLEDALTTVADESGTAVAREPSGTVAGESGTAVAEESRTPAAGVSVLELRFAEAGRRVGPDAADDARILLLHAAGAGPGTLARLYRQGTAAERRAVLHALPALVPGDEALDLVEDALRTNDTRLVAAALGPYGARHLPAHQWRHAVLKCLFTGVPLDTVGRLAERAHGDAELARMLNDFAAERGAAGRTVPADLYRVLALTEATPEPTSVPVPASAPQETH
ncbi:EboA domain-containing protein [Streptomyces sp. NPDC002734]|uniref:EboA domain-containing protein n=1 Tax=Streptomyces sp. NPDC002734 TaxID=3154426 RepID=UPI00332ACCB1